MSISYSAIKTHEACAARYKFSYIDRLPSPSGEAATRGTQLHAELEDALTCGRAVSEGLMHLAPLLDSLRSKNAVAERKIAVSKDWQPTAFDAPDAYIRGIIDALHIEQRVCHLRDWKSGKPRDYQDQVVVYTALVFANEPEIDTVRPIIELIDHAKTVVYPDIARFEFESLKDSIDSRVLRIRQDKVFAPNPSFNCKWCAYRKDNGGPCKW